MVSATGSDELTRQVFGELARASGSDGQKMVDALERGRSDPASFAATLSPEVRQRLRELSTKIIAAPLTRAARL